MVCLMPRTADWKQASSWSTRAWTYQEERLSKRLLFFSDAQVSLHCGHMCFCEDLQVLEGISQDSTGCRLFQHENTLHPSNGFGLYTYEVREFTKKLLSFEGDRLDAFSGVAQHLEKRLGASFLFGMPRSFLPIALLWQYGHGPWRTRDVSGNHHFPSWSWAGWAGEAWYFFCDEPYLVLDRIDWLEHTTVTLAQPPVLLQAPFSNPDMRYLKFYAWAVIFRLEHRQDISISWEYAFGSNVNPGPDCHYSTKVLDGEGRIAGGVDMRHLIEVEGVREGMYELIVLSRTCLPGQWTRTRGPPLDPVPKPQPRDDIADAGRSGPMWTEFDAFRRTMSSFAQSRFLKTDLFDILCYSAFKPWPLYNVMVIKRIGNVAYRVAVGKVHIDAIWAAKPVRRFICLG